MTIKPFHKVLATLVLCGFMGSAHAASVSLVTTDPTTDLAVGDVVTFDIAYDFSDTAAGTIGGGFDILFDSAVLAFDSFFRDPAIGEPDFSRDPDVGDGILDDWVVSAFNAIPNTGIFGTVTFVVAADFVETVVGLARGDLQGQTPSPSSEFVDASTFAAFPDGVVEYGSTTLAGQSAVIPVPAAVWLMLSGIGALVGFGRKS